MATYKLVYCASPLPDYLDIRQSMLVLHRFNIFMHDGLTQLEGILIKNAKVVLGSFKKYQETGCYFSNITILKVKMYNIPYKVRI